MDDITWNSYYDLQSSFVQQFSTGTLPSASVPQHDSNKKTAIISGKEVKRMPLIDDFADMMRVEDKDNHKRLERYVNPLGTSGGLDWFLATLLAVMIKNGRVGVKETVLGNQAVYIARARTGNPLFRIFGGRLTLLIAVAQWFLLGGIAWFVGSLDASRSYSDYDQKTYSFLLAAFFFGILFFYNIVHWRFYKRYSFVLGRTLIDGWKARSAPTLMDMRWSAGRPAIHAVNLSLFTTSIIVILLFLIKHVGWI